VRSGGVCGEVGPLEDFRVQGGGVLLLRSNNDLCGVWNYSNQWPI
jgi:hypothetical protein